VCHGAAIQDLSIWREIVGRRSPPAESRYSIQAIDLQISVEKGFFHFSPILTDQAFRPRRIATGPADTFLIDSLPYQLGNARGAQFASSNSFMSSDCTELAVIFIVLKRWSARGLIMCSLARIDLALTEAPISSLSDLGVR